jgi:hypothetical protein
MKKTAISRNIDAAKLTDLVTFMCSGFSWCAIRACKRSASQPGIHTGEYVEITAGLTGNEQVVNNFTPALMAGEQVRTAMIPNSEADYTASAKQ